MSNIDKIDTIMTQIDQLLRKLKYCKRKQNKEKT